MIDAPRELSSYPPPEKWEDWEEFEPRRREPRKYMIVPTVCFNCEAACGLLAYVDKATLQIRKLEGNPYSPNSRGRNCAKGPAQLNQVQDPERILYPLKRAGKRGEGKWIRTTWDEVLDTFGQAIRRCLLEKRGEEVMYHVGRPGEDGFVERVLQAWGLDAHNSHTNVCSSSARLGYDLWMGNDRPSPDYGNARFILLLSSHLETGHYFNPHAQRIMDAKSRGAKLAVIDTRLSNTASMADYWLPTWPGSEAAVLLAMSNIILSRDLFDREFVRRWVNWEEYLRCEHPDLPVAFENFVVVLKRMYAAYSLEFAEQESGLARHKIEAVALEIARAGSAFSAHIWRNAASGNLGGWQVARALFLLNVLTGSVGTVGGTAPNSWNKFIPQPPLKPPPQQVWNEMLFPPEYPLAHHEMSFLLPHFLKEGRARLSVYFTRAYNPVWTNPDGFSWMEVLNDERLVGLHAQLTPVWNETAIFADYVLPMGLGPERHDTMSFETHSSQWISFRQPVLRVAKEKVGQTFDFTHQANPGEVWEEAEFWIELSWRIDPDGSLGIRRYFESPYVPGRKMRVHEYYQWIFENSVPGLPAAAAREGLAPLDYMRKYGAFEVSRDRYNLFEQRLSQEELAGSKVDPVSKVIRNGDTAIGIAVDGGSRVGFLTPSRKLEFYSRTLADWGWRDLAVPGYVKSHVHRERIGSESNEFVLMPTFRLPTQIHTRSGNSKWLWEIAHTNPLWIHNRDARRLGLKRGDLVRVGSRIGHFVVKAYPTEAIMPGVVACSHHFGRWRIHEEQGERWSTALVQLDRTEGVWRLRQLHGVRPFHSNDPDSERIYWEDVGVHQNLTFPVQPDPLSGMHCWHQKVTLEKALPEDRYGDVVVDTKRAHEIYKEWLAMTKPAPGPNGLRRPPWLARPFRPAPEAFRMGVR